MKIEMTYGAYTNFGNLFPSAEIGRARYYDPAHSQERIAGIQNRNDLHFESQFSFFHVIKIDPDRSTRYARFVPSLKKWGTIVWVEKPRWDCTFSIGFFFETNVYSVDKEQELRYVHVGFKSYRRISDEHPHITK